LPVTVFPYTTLFRSVAVDVVAVVAFLPRIDVPVATGGWRADAAVGVAGVARGGVAVVALLAAIDDPVAAAHHRAERGARVATRRSEEHTSELQSRFD